MDPQAEHILVIRLGALGDLVFCFQAFHEIRQAHPQAHITLLTRAPFAAFARKMPYFDDILIDTHPSFREPLAWIKLLKSLKKLKLKRVYDLQGKRRQTILYMLLGGPFGPSWSGAAPLCKFPRLWPPKAGMSFVEFLAAQLRAAHVPEAPPTDLSWLSGEKDKFSLPSRYIVLIPGCSPTAPHKRWPANYYAVLAQKFEALAIPCVVIGTNDDRNAVKAIKGTAPSVIDLCGLTDLFELAAILRGALGAIGNDTGPVHMAAALSLPTLALFSGKSNPIWSKPPGPQSTVLQHKDLVDLDVESVFSAFNLLLKHSKSESR